MIGCCRLLFPLFPAVKAIGTAIAGLAGVLYAYFPQFIVRSEMPLSVLKQPPLHLGDRYVFRADAGTFVGAHAPPEHAWQLGTDATARDRNQLAQRAQAIVLRCFPGTDTGHSNLHSKRRLASSGPLCVGDGALGGFARFHQAFFKHQQG